MAEDKKVVAAHVEHRLLHDFAIDPDHDSRTESPMFVKSKERLKEDGHHVCYICGTSDGVQVHHRCGEYMFNNIVDYDLLKEFCEEWDLYGYGKLLKKQPITSVDDIRNQMCLCQAHHTGVNHEDGGGGTGIHSTSFNTWIMQKICLKGANPVPQKGETFDDAMKRIKQFERKVV
jgi:hypothetical protein